MNAKKLDKTNIRPTKKEDAWVVRSGHYNTLIDDVEALETQADTVETQAGDSDDVTSINYVSASASNAANISTLDGAVDILNSRADHTMDDTKIIKYPLMCTVTWDFAVDGGSVSTIDLNGGTEMIPDNAIITHVLQDVITAPNSSTSDGTIKLLVPTDGDLTAAITANNSTSGLVDGVPDNTATNMIKLTAARELQVKVDTTDLTAGKIKFFIWYVVSE